MSDDTDINWKARAGVLLLWLKVHPGFTVPAITFLMGMAVGLVL